MEISHSSYRTHPVHICPGLAIQQGHASLAQRLLELIQKTPQHPLISIDGFVGVEWSVFLAGLQTALAPAHLEIRWLSTEECLLPADQIEQHLQPFLTEDPVFGRLFHGRLEELWDADAAAALRSQVADRHCLTIVSGFGASLLAPDALQI